MDFYFETEERGRDGLRICSSLSFDNEECRRFYGMIYEFIHSLPVAEFTVIKDRECMYGNYDYPSIGQVWMDWELPHGDGWEDSEHSLEAVVFEQRKYSRLKKLAFGLEYLRLLEEKMGWEFVKSYLIISLYNNDFLDKESDIALTLGDIYPKIKVITDAYYQ